MNRHKETVKGLFIVVSAPSGTGKTSVCQQLMKKWPDLKFSVSYTTRLPRSDEKDGEGYHFISETLFREMIAQGEFAEWVENFGNLYGTARSTVDSSLGMGYDILIDVEPRGAKKLKQTFPGGIFVFLLPPSWEELHNRLVKRGGDREEAIKKRLQQAREESKEVRWYDYVIFNDCLDATVDQISAIYQAEKARPGRLQRRIDELLQCGCGSD